MKKLIVLFILTGQVLFSQKVTYDPIIPLENYNFVLGTQGIGGYYKFTEESALVEQAKHIRAMGSNILKISLGKNAPKAYKLPEKKVNTTLELFKSVPDYKVVFDMDFKYIFSWVHTLTPVKWRNKFTKEDEKLIFDEMYDFASYLLKEYNNSGKTFLIGNWEGDWLLHPKYNRKYQPTKREVKNMTKWFQVRQKAIDAAKKDTKSTNVSLFYYVEVNLVKKALQGETSISKDILKNVNPDLVSYSSYESIKNKNFNQKKETLDILFNYLEKQLKPKKNIPFTRRVYLGEYGYQANNKKPLTVEKQYNETKEIMQIALELNLPFALHWEMYNNEYTKSGISKEMSLITEQGKKKKLYYLHQNYYKEMNAYLKKHHQNNGKYPSQTEFNQKAISVMKKL